ncbi:hypothetical protein HSR121_0205 [Halapricum desulfuricans]|uniref:Uncharacterized protein n=1 Tax=Halapricum desulfuricans TaxID=2841257 RepID=A0A897MVM8_9EURY|nr:hypothetical protein HSR121_0205 [Halapricum desulfuricans]
MWKRALETAGRDRSRSVRRNARPALNPRTAFSQREEAGSISASD